jgi:hypothetical protein
MNTTIQTNSRFNPASIASRPPPGTRIAPPPVADVGRADLPVGLEPPPPPEPSCQAEVRPKTGGLKKLNFGNMATKKDEGGKKTYPVFTDADGRAAALAATIIEQQEQFDALEGSLKT